VYQDRFCQISTLHACRGVYQYYHQLPQARELLEPSMRVILSVAKLWSSGGIPVFYWLEVKEGEFLPSEDVTWIRKDVLPQLVEAGIRYVAYVSRNNLFRNFSQENILDTEQSKRLSLRVFQENEDALLWLEQLKK
jgi:hypothetical protein